MQEDQGQMICWLVEDPGTYPRQVGGEAGVTWTSHRQGPKRIHWAVGRMSQQPLSRSQVSPSTTHVTIAENNHEEDGCALTGHLKIQDIVREGHVEDFKLRT